MRFEDYGFQAVEREAFARIVSRFCFRIIFSFDLDLKHIIAVPDI
jgi:hypothetical protein